MRPEDLFAPPPPLPSAGGGDPLDRFVADVLRESADATGGYGIFGLPFDGAVIGRPGARFGPDAIRRELVKLKPWRAGRGETPFRLRDFGNVRLPRTSVDDAHERTEVAVRHVIQEGFVPVALGGDHSLGYPLVHAHSGQRVGVVNIDAHLDLRDVHGEVSSGTPFGRLLGHDDLLSGENLVEVGIRDFATSPGYGDKAVKHGVHVVGVEPVRRGPDSVARDAVERASAGTTGVYVSLDMDVLDQAHGPGVSAPTPGGLATSELYAFLAALGARLAETGTPLVGFDVVEVAPPLDDGDRTARAAAHALMTFLAAYDAGGR